MLTSVRLENWRGHVDTTVPLAPFTVLVGANAVGKTAVLEAIDAVGRAVHGERTLRGRALDRVVREGADLASLTMTLAHNSESAVQLLVGRAPHDNMELSLPGRPQLGRFLSAHAGHDPYGSYTRTLLRPLTCLLLEPSPRRIAMPSRIAKYPCDSDGFGTASVLASLKLNAEDRFRAIVERVRRVVPLVDTVQMRNSPALERTHHREDEEHVHDTFRTHDGFALWVKFIDGATLPAEAVSEGTLLAIATLTMIENHHAGMLLIDDIDRALHMEAQSEYVKVLRDVQRERPDLQIVATTHSPLVVQHFEDDEVVVMARRADKTIAAKRLSQHPDRARYASLSAAEFWVAEQEQWVVQ
ncbi:MAG: AAA family ATPase [Myxococcales bacterium]|nr:AAA family ATPase [Myxococcales bacterium]